ncbi:uncharacterized protein Dana_GF12496 [Drosophila ananassae]|uniref:SET domain-containing protein n=1 Tax=Drosophila ananassae TaxID=7217 RepID=B3ME54_DROAN|nr:SET and MYND domain-containing protein 4 [Drosophila ananassae]EDV35449.1 uncharacterized protein Dana_GF12496 [Drosophila ananassae]
MDRLAKVFSQQDELIALEGLYKDEYFTFESLKGLPAEKGQRFHQLTLQLLEDLPQPVDPLKCTERSRQLREEGNLVFRSATKDPERVLKACKLYTGAVFEAEAANEELALAFANRGIALQEYGFFREAYDDCANALDCGYPEKMRHKLVMRQAHCAWKLEDLDVLEKHLSSLEQMQLNESFLQQLENLKNELEILKRKEADATASQQKQDIKSLEKISEDPGERGRYMVATEAIPQGTAIFSERASCFVPLEQRLICQQCASSLMSAPIPCPQCHQKVVYCSRKCREGHANIHRYECAGYRMDLFKLLGVSHLALRMVLVYVPLILPDLRDCKSSKEIWESLMKLVNEPEQGKMVPEYMQSLRMVSHLDQAPRPELVYHMLCANLLQTYLEKHTDYFDLFKVTAAGSEDWKVIVSALILRSAGQLLVNGHVGDALVPVALEANEFALLQPDMWQKPYHLRLGQLHNLSHTELVTAVNLPYLSLCNHACVPSIRTKFDGCSVVNYARSNIAAGEEIFNCYTRDYRNSLKSQRIKPLKEVYKFQCSCVACVQAEPDKDYLAFHQYLCEKKNCRKKFIPDVQQNDLTWWMQSNADNPIVCTLCKERQSFAWYNEFLDLIESCGDSSKRRELYRAFDKLDNWLVDHHSLKGTMAGELVTACFAEMDDGCFLTDFDYENLARIIRKNLESTAAQCGDTSMEYISQMTYLWDIVALKKCKMDKKELGCFTDKLKYLAQEHKEVFMNYYNDFIKEQCK